MVKDATCKVLIGNSGDRERRRVGITDVTALVHTRETPNETPVTRLHEIADSNRAHGKITPSAFFTSLSMVPLACTRDPHSLHARTPHA
jgi:hypothetical protein